ncbi:hypothetical protein [Priestia abyssalis]|uniref:hypothetical protein n=1 Tax=Priestia abyssalis TaxID=1221450 RepID=UPI00099586EF|nr:hypothetical protein [Priestia abyssalis]
MNRAGKYASSDKIDDIQLMNMVIELTEKEKMAMWSEGYIDSVIEKLPVFARDILENRKKKWEDTKEYVQQQINDIVHEKEFLEKLQAERKEFALYVMSHYPQYQSLLFHYYDGNMKESDFKRFVYRNRYTKNYLH